MISKKILIDDEYRQYIAPFIKDEKFIELKKYIAHGSYSVYNHCLRVSILAYSIAKRRKMKIDYRSLVRGCLLHDFYLYDWHKKHEGHRLHGFRHPYFALHNAIKYYSLNKKEKNMIQSHMFPLTFWTIPLSKEALLLTLADKICARKETRLKRGN